MATATARSVARFSTTMCRVMDSDSKKPGGMNAAGAHAVIESTSTAPSRCQAGPRLRSSAISPTASRPPHTRNSQISPRFPDRCWSSQVTTMTRDSIAPGG